MTVYIEYELDDGSKVLVESSGPDASGALESAVGIDVINAGGKFSQALISVKASARQLVQQFEDLSADDVEVTFGLTATADVGNGLFAIGKLSVGANYEVTLKWRKPDKLIDYQVQVQPDQNLNFTLPTIKAD